MPPILLERQGRTATLTLHRPPLNILDLEMMAALSEALAELEKEDSGDVPTVVFLRGAGERAFSAGVSVQDHTPDKIESMLAGLHGAIHRLRRLPAIVVAAVSGHCLGGGMELALACDLVIATADARFGQPEIDLGCFPPVAAALYPARLGAGRTMAMLALGQPFDAVEAERLGLVQRLLPAGGLAEGCRQLAAELEAKSAAVLRLTKKAVAAGRELPFEPALAAAERVYLDELAATDDMREGIAAFLEKRRPAWSHR